MEDITKVEQKRPKILIIDDEKINIDILLNMLKEDYKLVIAKDGQQAMMRLDLHDGNPDLILLDIVMPGMDGFEVCRRLKANSSTRGIPVIFLTSMTGIDDETKGFEAGAVDFITKPFNPAVVKARVKTHLALYDQNRTMEDMVNKRTEQLQVSTNALEEALRNLQTTEIVPGVYWVQVPGADLYVLCGAPADVVKHMMIKGYISRQTKDGVTFETGPNAILLSEVLIQNGMFSNLAEFPVLQMLYRQGMLLPGHPRNTGVKPLLIGSREQVNAQMNYIYRGNYGLTSVEELVQGGLSPQEAQQMMAIKLKFAFGGIRPTTDFVDTIVVEQAPVEIKNGVYIRRTGFNRYEFQYKGRTTEVDLNLAPDQTYESPYTLGFHDIGRHYFSVIHSGQGDGWDTRRQSMASILVFQGNIYLIDASPGIVFTLKSLGIDISEIKGIFHTHAHDDHFCGLPALIQSDHRIKYYATPVVRASVSRKLSALMSMEEERFFDYFDVSDLQVNQWNDCDGLEVKPVYSPHPVETNILFFRAQDDNGYKTYAHLADIVSLELLKKMCIPPGESAISPTFFDDVKANYLLPVDLKKIDAGGGLIHGQASDFKNDDSGRVVLAHTSTALTNEQKEIGSEAVFGSVDVLIPTQQDYIRRAAYLYLKAFFPTIDEGYLRVLLNTKILRFSAGSLILGKDDTPCVYLILSGSVEFILSSRNIHNLISVGSLIGERALFTDEPQQGSWRAISHVNVMRFSVDFFRGFLKKHDLFDFMKSAVNNIAFLQGTWLFGEGISYMVLNRIAHKIVPTYYNKGERISGGDLRILFLTKEGEVNVYTANGNLVFSCSDGGFFGEDSIVSSLPRQLIFETSTPSTVYHIDGDMLLEIPVVHWKLLEIHSKRRNM
ncbi:response regulator [Candidatus Magnetobacterium casense]|uniref:Response regulator n=1 Tax=Candidatus Magnetobacterium casense TaxID=1455061 RepID=A0ABS6RWR8_9BACT|nr:response regulator [Candidatus Magnetobacterium casensis]MBV6341068.1 response regulator [Candidatus Magnetobacterium casensis]